MKSIIVTLATLGFAVAANAATPIQSEFFYQADTDNNVITPELQYNTNTFEMKGATKQDTTGQILNLAYERGLTEMYSVGGALGYLTATTEVGTTDSDTKGLNDFTFFAKGRYAFAEGGSMHYGADLYFSPGDQETDGTETDAVSGGNSLRPWVGYQWLMGSNVIGTRLTTDFLLGKKSRKNTVTNTKTEVEGGEVTDLTAFYEIPHEMGAVGFTVSYNYLAEEKVGSAVTSNGYNTMGLGVYSPYRFSETATVIGNLNWSKVASSNIGGTDIDSSSNISLSVAGRFMF